MKSFKIVIDDSDVFQSEEMYTDDQARYVDMIFYIKLEENYFPYKDWTDFVCPVMFQWAENILKNKGRTNVCYALYFMDGPYRIDVFQSHSSVKLQGVSDREEEDIWFEFSCSYKDLIAEVYRAVSRLNSIFKANPIFMYRFENIIESAKHYEQLLKSEIQSLK